MLLQIVMVSTCSARRAKSGLMRSGHAFERHCVCVPSVFLRRTLKDQLEQAAVGCPCHSFLCALAP